MGNHLYKGDLPPALNLGPVVAIDSETMGLNPCRDRLCLVQLSSGDGNAHLVQLDRENYATAPRLKALLADRQTLKLMHFARFDMTAFQHWLGVATGPVYCTKIASKLARTYTDRHSLKELARELLGIEMSKQQQSSDWGAAVLADAQLDYAAADVLYLHAIKEKLDEMLTRENRTGLAKACFDFLPTRVALDLAGWPESDIFAHE
jgi:ribonuclease D